MMMHRMMNCLKCLSLVQISKEQYSQRYISEIIGVRLEELFELVLEELYRMGVQDLPGGVVITGGVAKMDGLTTTSETCIAN